MAAEVLLEINGLKYNASGVSFDFYKELILRENLCMIGLYFRLEHINPLQ